MTFLWAGGEDMDFANLNAAGTVDTTAGHFRSGYARCGLSCPVSGSGPVSDNTVRSGPYWRTLSAISSSSFWLSAQVWSSAVGGRASNSVVNYSGLMAIIRLVDVNAVPRIQISGTVGNATAWSSSGPWVVQTLNSAGTRTTIGSSFGGFTASTATKIDIFINYAVSGTMQVYLNGGLVYSFTGDVTTNSVTSLAYVDFGLASSATGDGAAGSGVTVWSEVVIDTIDTRSIGLVTLAPVALGTTHAWTGTVAMVNETTLDTSAGVDTAVAGQLEEFTVGAMPSGTFSVRHVVPTALASAVATVPQHMDMALRVSGADYFSADQTVTAPLSRVLSSFDTNPATSGAWLATDLSGIEFGFKSIA